MDNTEKKQVIILCLSCWKKIGEYKVDKYGDGYVVVCPFCNELAYNSKEDPEELMASAG